MILKKIIFLYQPYLHSYLNGIYPMLVLILSMLEKLFDMRLKSHLVYERE